MFKKISFVLASMSLLTACSGSKDYTPPEGATGLEMYTESCVSCHTPIEVKGEFYYWQMMPENTNAEYVKGMIANGSMTMPSYPNIKGKQLEVLTQFVLENNVK